VKKLIYHRLFPAKFLFLMLPNCYAGGWRANIGFSKLNLKLLVHQYLFYFPAQLSSQKKQGYQQKSARCSQVKKVFRHYACIIHTLCAERNVSEKMVWYTDSSLVCREIFA
jgi:hypothetical protein